MKSVSVISFTWYKWFYFKILLKVRKSNFFAFRNFFNDHHFFFSEGTILQFFYPIKEWEMNVIMYYFRTVCNNCKCPREAHDVCHEEFVNVCDRIGFQPSPEPSRHPISKEKTLSEGYSWVPPGLSSYKVMFCNFWSSYGNVWFVFSSIFVSLKKQLASISYPV